MGKYFLGMPVYVCDIEVVGKRAKTVWEHLFMFSPLKMLSSGQTLFVSICL